MHVEQNVNTAEEWIAQKSVSGMYLLPAIDLRNHPMYVIPVIGNGSASKINTYTVPSMQMPLQTEDGLKADRDFESQRSSLKKWMH